MSHLSFKSDQLIDCVLKSSLAFEKCMDANETITARTTIDNAVTFICENDGRRIVEFVENEGPQCFAQSAPGILECYKGVFNTNTMEEIVSHLQRVSSHPSPENCKISNSARSCLVNEMKTCRKRKPAELMDSFFKMLLEGTPCSSASSASLSILTLLFGVIFVASFPKNVFL